MELPKAFDQSPLAGVRVLVVEDDTFILLDLESILLDAGAEIVGSCRTVGEAILVLEAGRVDAAILDFGLGDGTVAILADRLQAQGTPFCFYTGQVDTDPRLEPWRDHKLVPKPAQPQAIIAAIHELVTAENQARRAL